VSLTGYLLIASPTLGDPNFARTVVFVIHHGDPGAVGLVLNRPTTLAVERLPQGWTIAGPVYAGGPVEPEIAIGLADADTGGGDWEQVAERIWLADLESMPPESVPRIRVFSGYAGWGSGQLEEEIGRGDWIVAEAALEDVFTEDPGRLWRAVLERQPDPIRLLAAYPPNPSLN
jgi:putative transcriptional regulator